MRSAPLHFLYKDKQDPLRCSLASNVFAQYLRAMPRRSNATCLPPQATQGRHGAGSAMVDGERIAAGWEVATNLPIPPMSEESGLVPPSCMYVFNTRKVPSSCTDRGGFTSLSKNSYNGHTASKCEQLGHGRTPRITSSRLTGWRYEQKKNS